ncbi:MAG TPA: serine/threonine protein phosphatase, partial [Allocoleopsis sp.]
MTTHIQCVNIQGNCQHFNKLSDHFCTNCGTPLVKRYLFALSDKITTEGEKLADRYVIVKPGVLLDTLPAMTPETTDEVPQELVPYLKLFVHRLHIPQVYGFVTDSKYGTIWLLEDGPICHEGEYAKYPGQLMPTLNQSWQSASALRQLHWLWQIAKLWDAMQNQGVAKSLLQPELL